MAWKLVNPNITNDPSYLDPRLSDDESKISSNTTSLAQIATQAIDPTRSPYNAVGDGVTDDTSAIQNAINALTSGGRIILTKKFKITTINLASDIIIDGIGQNKCGFISSSATIINVPNLSVRWVLSNFGIFGDVTASTGINLAGDAGGIADFSVRDVYVNTCKVGMQSTFAWAFVFSRVRFQGCKTALILNSQTNQGNFLSCSFKVTSQVATLSNCSSLNFTGCELAGSNHDGTVPITFFQCEAINFTGNYIETFASNINLMLIGTLSQTIPNKGIKFSGNMVAWNTTGSLISIYQCDGLDITNNSIHSGVAYLITDNIGSVKGLKIDGNTGFIYESVLQNLIPNYNFFAWSNGVNTLPNNVNNLSSTPSMGSDGSLQLVTSVSSGGCYFTLNESNLPYFTFQIEVMSSVANTVYVDFFIDGVYKSTINITVPAGGSYTKNAYYVYTNATSLTFFRIRFANAGTHNIKSVRAYRGIAEVDKDKKPSLLASNVPTIGTFNLKDVVENSNPAASGYKGWICVTGGVANNTAWAATTTYTLGQQVNTGGKVYQCTTAGTSGTTAPTGTGTGITDGTVVWNYINTLAVFKGYGVISA